MPPLTFACEGHVVVCACADWQNVCSSTLTSWAYETMSDDHLDRELLFGILAWQMGFISREQLLASLKQHLDNPTISLATLLVEQNALNKTVCDSLMPLIEQHIDNHNGDPQQSLAALSSIGTLFDDLAKLRNSTVDATLTFLASKHDTERSIGTLPPAEAHGSTDEHRAGRGDLRYRIVRLHAQGGLGEVSLAKDTELNREVALKEIKAQYADDENSRSRFLLEAEVTGGLEHPGIVPVYGLGRYADGRPFYAMRFIKGDSLAEAVDSLHHRTPSPSRRNTHLDYHSSSFRKLLGRFIDICSAIEYAHSRGVLHRDLKPGNIMLGKYGETLVVDWGLAKIKDQATLDSTPTEDVIKPASASGSAPTELGSVVGTPAYMSPEQAAGRLDQLGVTSDVYSLGATLFYVLTGQPPFKEKNLPSLLEAVQRGDFQTPREILPAIPRPLEAICLKAMSQKMDQRYATAAELADDLEHWLADEKVQAFADPVWVRARRWLRRHQTLATSVASVALVTLVLLVVGLGLLAEANTRLDSANAQLNSANVQLASSLARESEARAQAVASGERADENFRLARKAVDDYFVDVSENLLLDVPGMQPLRQQLLDAALNYYSQFIENESETAGVKSELAAAHFRLGKLTFSTGQPAEARRHFENAQALYSQIVAASESQELTLHLDYASTYEHLALTAESVNETDSIEADHRKALEMREVLFAKNPENHQVASGLIHSCNNLAILTRKTGRYEESQAFLDRAISVGRSMLELDATNTKHLGTLAISYNEYGVLLANQGKPEEAAESYQKSIELWQDLSGQNPETTLYRNYLASAYTNLGGVQRTIGDNQASLMGYQQAVSVFQELTARNPSVILYRDNLAHAQQNLGNLLFASFQRDEALAAMNAALEIRKKLVGEQPENIQFQNTLAAAYHNLGNLQRDIQDYEQAQSLYAQAIAIWEPMSEKQPGTVAVEKGLGAAYIGAGYLEYLQGDLEACLPFMEKAIPLLETKADMKGPLQISHMIAADALEKLERFADAAAAYEQAISLQSGPSRNALQLKRALVLARDGQHQQATTEARTLMLPDQVPLETIYDAACVFALSAEQASNDQALTSDTRDDLVTKYQDDALVLLNRAQESGYFDSPQRQQHVDSDTDLDSLRELDSFQRWRAQLQPADEP